MALLQLPYELLDIIIIELFPECFDHLLLTCRRLYAVCRPHLQRYNVIRRPFQTFVYDKSPDGSGIHCSCQLLSCIARRPYISRWIIHADFSDDPPWERVRRLPASVTTLDKAVIALYEDSRHFQAANASQEEFRKEYSTRAEFRWNSNMYPDHYMYFAPTMLLTQLPNVRTIILPRDQRPTHISKRVLEEVIDRSQAMDAVRQEASLAKLTKLQTCCDDKTWSDTRGSKLQYLPRLEQIVANSSSLWLGAGIQPSTALRSLSLPHSFDDQFVPEKYDLHHQNAHPRCVENALGPWANLKTLRYSRSLSRGYRGQQIRADDVLLDMDRILSAMQDFVGEHLEELAFSLDLTACFPAACRSSLRRFKKLRRLELGLEVALCNIAVMLPFGSDESEFEDLRRDPSNPLYSVLEDLVPPSVRELSLLSVPNDDEYKAANHDIALAGLFHDFERRRRQLLPKLEEIYLDCYLGASEAYKVQCAKTRLQAHKAGVGFKLRISASTEDRSWGSGSFFGDAGLPK